MSVMVKKVTCAIYRKVCQSSRSTIQFLATEPRKLRHHALLRFLIDEFKDLFESEVVPLLHKNGHSLARCIGTESAGHAGQLLAEFMEKNEGDVTLILGSGDGTLHEIVNHLSTSEIKGVRAGLPPSHLHLVLIPCGTANALYSTLFPPSTDLMDISYKLRSLKSFIDGGRTVPLTLAITTLSSPPSERKRPRGEQIEVMSSPFLAHMFSYCGNCGGVDKSSCFNLTRI